MSVQRLLSSALAAARGLFLASLTRSRHATPWPLAQVSLEEGALNDVPRLQPYGYASMPPVDGVAVVASIAGKPLILLTDHGQFRVELSEGEVALYNDQGDSVRLGADRRITLTAGAEVILNAAAVTCTGTLTAQTVRDANGSMQSMRDTYNTHTHASVGVPPSNLMT